MSALFVDPTAIFRDRLGTILLRYEISLSSNLQSEILKLYEECLNIEHERLKKEANLSDSAFRRNPPDYAGQQNIKSAIRHLGADTDSKDTAMSKSVSNMNAAVGSMVEWRDELKNKRG